MVNENYFSTSYYVFHGGAVSWEGKGIIICAYSAFGKTTLVLELIRRGFSFLSDDLVPISRSSYLVKPFPGSIHVSRDTLTLFPELSPYAKKTSPAKPMMNGVVPCGPGKKQGDIHKGGMGHRKYKVPGKHKKGSERITIDIEDIPWGKMGEDCPPKYTIFLSPPGGIRAKKRFVELAVSYATSSFLEELHVLRGVKEVSEIVGRDFALLRLRVDEKLKMIPAIEKLCRRYEIPIIYAHTGRAEPMDWDAPPRMRSIPVSQGVIELARMLTFSSKSAILREEFSGRTGRLLTEMARLARKMKFYKMVPGKIREMGEIVDRLVKKT